MDWYLMVWRKFAEFNGRARRTEYWMFVLFNLLALVVLGLIGGAGRAISREFGGVLFIPFFVYLIAAIVPTLAVATRRFHDTGKSGWILLLLIVLGFIPFVGIVASIIQIIFLCIDSSPGTNQYGPNPKSPEQTAGVFAGDTGFSTLGFSAQPQPPAGESGHSFCKSCGARIEAASTICGKCGVQV